MTKSLLQESYDYCKKGVLIEIKTQLESLFKVQSTPKSEEMEDASRGYGLLLHAFGLRTEEIKAKYSTLIKGKVSLYVIQGGCGSSCSVAVSPFAACYYTSILAKLYVTVSITWISITCSPPTFA